MAITYEGLPKIDVNLRQIRAVDANVQIPFNATILCRAKNGPIDTFVPLKSYSDAVQLFGLGDATTPALYGFEQVLKSYGTLNIIRLASDKAAKGIINIDIPGKDLSEQVVPECDTHTWEITDDTATCTVCGATATLVDGEVDDTTISYTGNVTTKPLAMITGETDYCTDIFNGDEIKLHYESTRTRLAIRGKLNGTTFNTPLEIIDLSTATAPQIEAVLDKLVTVWNELNTGIQLTNNYINKLEVDDTIITSEILPSGTVELGNSGNDEQLSNEYVIRQLSLLDDPRITKQDVVLVPEFHNYEVVNAGLALKNKYFFITSATGDNVIEKQDNIQLYDASDEGVCYIPSKCTLADENIVVPFEVAALLAWATSFSVSRYFAPAGTNRATMPIITDIKDNLTDDDAEILYNLEIPANPVKYISNFGYTLYGQKTMDASKEFTNRINVSGLVNYITITGKNLLAPYLFEYTPISTFQQVYMDLQKMLDHLVSSSVIYPSYTITCDESNNTDKTLGDHELHAAVAFRPINVVEYIYLDLTVTDELGGEF